MKRDMELIRKILLTIEEQYIDTALYNIKIEGYDLKTIAYHCDIMHEAGIISDYGASYAEDELYSFGVGHLTWQGHEFLDAAKNDTVWNKAMTVVKEKGGSVTLDIMKELLGQLMTSLFFPIN